MQRIHLNTQGIKDNVFILEGYLLGLSAEFICISEHWLRSDEVKF